MKARKMTEIKLKGDFTETTKAWVLWDWNHNCFLEEEEGKITIFTDPELAEEYRARTCVLCVMNEDGTEPDEEIYSYD